MFRLPLLIAAGIALVSVPVAAAAGEWQERADVRLLDGGTLGDGQTRLAGLEIVLDSQWKTYWRNPGDSGIPPKMDFSASGNVAEVTIEWPAPEAHFDGYGWVIGYTDAVIFPLLVRAEDPAAPSRLDVKLDYAVCKDICVPAQAEASIELDGERARAGAIDFYRDRIPVRLEAATEQAGVVSSSVVEEEGAPRLRMRLKFPGDPADAFAVVEGPDGWYLPVPEKAGTDADGNAIFEVSLDGVDDPATIHGARLRVTGVSPVFSFEQTVALD